MTVFISDRDLLLWTHTSTCALVDIPITIVVFFVCQIARKTRSKEGPLSRWTMDAVSELQPANAIASAKSQVAGRAEFEFEPFLDCDRV